MRDRLYTEEECRSPSAASISVGIKIVSCATSHPVREPIRGDPEVFPVQSRQEMYVHCAPIGNTNFPRTDHFFLDKKTFFGRLNEPRKILNHPTARQLDSNYRHETRHNAYPQGSEQEEEDLVVAPGGQGKIVWKS